MKHRNRHQEPDQAGRNDAGGLMRNPEWIQLQDSLRDMVAGESEHVRHPRLTDNILRAVRPGAERMRNFDELWSGALVSWFRPVVVAGLLLIVLLAAYNARQTSSEIAGLTTTERVLGLHPVTIASAYDLELNSISE